MGYPTLLAWSGGGSWGGVRFIQVGQVWDLRDLKPVPLQKAAQIGNFALVNPKVSLCSAIWGEPRSI